ncbi:hypothetical protein [Roseomonas sp. USHLN139]|uniref:hypothetical protein n=1 Tax=Roseomonas sp. USHLN139 TaxID=3081298 RepID=UPI003B012388
MGAFADSRQRFLARRGRPGTLRRQTSATPVSYAEQTLPTIPHAFLPNELTGGVLQGDQQAEIGLVPAAWPGPPRADDTLLLDGQRWTVKGATAVYQGAELIGWTLWIRGGK